MDVIIKESGIDAKGAFANKNFAKGEVVLKWNLSNQISKEKFERLTEDEKRYVTFVDGKYTIMQEPERYVNHSCDSNTHVGNFADIASRDILKGEEVTSDYSGSEAPGFTMKCNCGSKNCKGKISV